MKNKLAFLILVMPILCFASDKNINILEEKIEKIEFVVNEKLSPTSDASVKSSKLLSNQEKYPEEKIIEAKRAAQISAIGDSVSTHLALAAGGVELNPLVNISPGGLVALALIKLGIIEAVDRMGDPQDRAEGFSLMSGLFTWATVNNLLIAASATSPLAVVGGVMAGIFTYKNQIKKFNQKTDKLNTPINQDILINQDNLAKLN